MSHDPKLVEAVARAIWPQHQTAGELLAATAALDAIAVAGRLVPDAWVAVPREPTLAVALVGGKAIASGMKQTGAHNWDAMAAYRAMVAAASEEAKRDE